MHRDDMLLLGADLVKSRDLLERAYNDSREITARFNRNILRVVNEIAATDFQPERFAHVAFFNEQHSRIEMHLRALNDMVITSPHLCCPLRIDHAESIHTENSYKFTIEQLVTEIGACGLHAEAVLTDHRKWFCLLQIRRGAG
jgi:L-histidine N-alpha-methyltransferase